MAGESRGVRAFSCAQCGAPVKVRAAGVSMSSVCPSCKSVVDVNDPNHKVLSAFQGAWKKLIPLGLSGRFEGARFEVLAFLVRAPEGDAEESAFQWEEYLLFHPLKGYRWLVQAQGHWSWVTPTKRQPQLGSRAATLEDRRFRLFHKGKAKVLYAEGELYWRVKAGETVDVDDYVAPPLMLSREAVGSSEVTWSRGEYMAREAVAAALKLDLAALPRPIGVAPHQPSPYGDRPRRLVRLAMLLAAALFVLQVGSCMRHAGGKELLSDGGVHRQGDVEPHFTPEFTLKGDGPLTFRLSVDILDNSWFEAGIVLIDVDTGTQRAFELGVEHYHGIEDGEAWQEGSKATSRILPHVPAGRYKLAVTPASGVAGGGPTGYVIAVASGGVLWGNFWLALVAVLLYPGWLWLQSRSFEGRRWAESMYGGDG